MVDLVTWLNRLKWAVVIYIVGSGVLAILGALPARAAISDQQAASIYRQALKQYGGPEIPMPLLRSVPQSELRKLSRCESKDCPVHGITIDGDIWINEALDDGSPLDRSILFHEYVHYLQYMRGVVNPSDWLALECEAFALQIEMLLREHHDIRRVSYAARSYGCR